jgi:hypothetical protein
VLLGWQSRGGSVSRWRAWRSPIRLRSLNALPKEHHQLVALTLLMHRLGGRHWRLSVPISSLPPRSSFRRVQANAGERSKYACSDLILPPSNRITSRQGSSVTFPSLRV